MSVTIFISPSSSPGPRRPALPARVFQDLPLQCLGSISITITRSQTPSLGSLHTERPTC